MSESLAVHQIFVYGTLMSHFDNPMAYVLERNCQLVGKGTFPGKIYYVQNEYPAGVHEENAETKVYGQIFTIAPEAFQQVMRLLDQYENYHESSPETSLFLRTVIPIYSDGHKVPCWTYLYNQPTEGLTLIESGNFWQFLRDQNLHKNP